MKPVSLEDESWLGLVWLGWVEGHSFPLLRPEMGHHCLLYIRTYERRKFGLNSGEQKKSPF